MIVDQTNDATLYVALATAIIFSPSEGVPVM